MYISGTQSLEDAGDTDDEKFDLRAMHRKQRKARNSRGDDRTSGAKLNDDVCNEDDTESYDEHSEDAVGSDGMCAEAANSDTYRLYKCKDDLTKLVDKETPAVAARIIMDALKYQEMTRARSA